MPVKAFVLDDDLRLRRLTQDALIQAGVTVVNDVVDADVLVVRAITRLTRYHVHAKPYDDARALLQEKNKRLPIVGYTELAPADVPPEVARRIKGGTSEMFFGPLRPAEVAVAAKTVGERRIARPRPPGPPPTGRPAPTPAGRKPAPRPGARPRPEGGPSRGPARRP